MARRSLKPQLNQIREWVRQGRTDAWIAHQLEVSVAELREFRDQHKLTPDEEDTGSKEMELRDEIEAEVEAATAEEVDETEQDEEAGDETEQDEEAGDKKEPDEDEEKAAETEQQSAKPERGEGAGTRPRRRRRRGRRGGRGRRKELEATFDHGERDGYGFWLDPSVKDNPVYAEHWSGKREVSVRIEPDQIVIRRVGAGADEDDDSGD